MRTTKRNGPGARRAVGVSAGTTALLLTAATPALACLTPNATADRVAADGTAATGVTRTTYFERSQAEWTGTLQQGLDALAARVAAKRADVEAMPASTVLSARQAAITKAKLAWVSALESRLDALAAAAPGGLTTAQAAQVADIKADLQAIVVRISAILDNGVAAASVTSTATKVHHLTLSRAAVLAAAQTRHHCDGFRDGSRADRSWGDRDGDHDRSWGDRDGGWHH
jgi:hypothetical protein